MTCKYAQFYDHCFTTRFHPSSDKSTLPVLSISCPGEVLKHSLCIYWPFNPVSLIVFFHTSFCLFLLFSFFQINLGKFKWVKSWGSQRNNKARRASSKKIWVERGNKIQPHNKIISLISRSMMPPKSSRHKRRRAERRKTPVFPVSSHMGTHSSHEGSTRIA